MDASRKDFEATKEPPVGQLANYLLLMRQLSVFAWELQNEVAAHGGADRFVIGATIVVFGKEFLAGDAWKDQSERELRKRLDGSFPKAMRIILAMKPTCDLVTDIRATLSDVFKTKPTIHAEQAHAFLRDLDGGSITKDG
ncbi:Di-copper centre-containing protein [Apiospora arundinis]